MARIKIEDLSKDFKISKEDLKKVMGGRKSLYPPGSRIRTPSSDGDYSTICSVCGACYTQTFITLQSRPDYSCSDCTWMTSCDD